MMKLTLRITLYLKFICQVLVVSSEEKKLWLVLARGNKIKAGRTEIDVWTIVDSWRKLEFYTIINVL